MITVPPGWGEAFAIALFVAVLTATAPAVRDGPTGPTPPTTAPAPANARCPQWWNLALDVGWPPGEMPTVDRVMKCESNCDPAAHNKSGADGLMQLMDMWTGDIDPHDPEANLRVALHVREVQGWRAWSCY